VRRGGAAERITENDGDLMRPWISAVDGFAASQNVNAYLPKEPKSSNPDDELEVAVGACAAGRAAPGAGMAPFAGGGDSMPLGGASSPPLRGFGAGLCVAAGVAKGSASSSTAFFLTAWYQKQNHGACDNNTADVCSS
jgi:hypothetical protein